MSCEFQSCKRISSQWPKRFFCKLPISSSPPAEGLWTGEKGGTKERKVRQHGLYSVVKTGVPQAHFSHAQEEARGQRHADTQQEGCRQGEWALAASRGQRWAQTSGCLVATVRSSDFNLQSSRKLWIETPTFTIYFYESLGIYYIPVKLSLIILKMCTELIWLNEEITFYMQVQRGFSPPKS